MADIQSEQSTPDGRSRIALIVLSFALGVTAVVAAIALVKADQISEVKDLLGMLLPMLSAWIGTILAFYFGRENFESAARSTRDLVNQLTSDEKLRTTKTEAAMIPISQATTYTLPAEGPAKVQLQRDLLQDCFIAKKRNRLPILDANGCVQFVAHRSLIDRFIVETITDKPGQSPVGLTLADMVGTDQYKRILQDAVGTVREGSSLADAKALIDRVPDCLDVFVTQDGTAQTRVLGWLTNVIILERARV